MGNKKSHKFFNGIDETMSVDNCTHSFFGASKVYADLIVQEYGKYRPKTLILELVVLLTNHSAQITWFLSYLKASLIMRYLIIIGKQVRDNIHNMI